MHKYIDLTGQKFGKLTAVSYIGNDENGNAVWSCKCDCGNQFVISSKKLKARRNPMCKTCRQQIPNRRVKDITIVVNLAMKGDEEAIEVVIKHYTPLIKKQIEYWRNRISPYVFEYDDLMQLGRIAIWQELQLKNLNTFFQNMPRRVASDIRDEMIRNGRRVRLPAIIPEEQYKEITCISLNTDSFGDNQIDIDKIALSMQFDKIRNLKILKPRQYEILYLRYVSDKTFVEIGKRYGLTTERVRQIHNKSLYKLRSELYIGE